MAPALCRGGTAAEAMHGMEIEKPPWVNRVEGEGREAVERGALDCYAEGDEGVVHCASSVSCCIA